MNSPISVTYSIFPGVNSITPKLNQAAIGVFEVTQVLFLLKANILSSCTESFWNTIAGLYVISPIVCQVTLLSFLNQ